MKGQGSLDGCSYELARAAGAHKPAKAGCRGLWPVLPPGDQRKIKCRVDPG